MKRFGRTIRQKMYILITVVCLIPLSIVTIYSLHTFSRQVKDTAEDSMNQICQSVSYNIDLIFRDIKDASNALLATDELQNGIQNGTLSRWELSKSIINLMTNKSFITSTVVTLQDYSVYSRTNVSAATYGEKYANVNMEDFESFIFRNHTVRDTSIWTLWMDGCDFYIPDDNCVFFSRSINSLTTLKKCGDMFIGIDKQLFSNICNNELNQSDFAVYITSDDHTVFSTKPDEALEHSLLQLSNTDTGFHKIGSLDYLIDSTVNPTTGWTVYCTLPNEYLSHAEQNVVFFTLLLGFAALIVSLLAAYGITYRVTKQIYLLTSAIDQLEQQDFPTISFDLNDEIGLLGNRFQTVVAENYRLTTSLYETTLKRKEAEYMMLQSQINPHFLYNTLNNLYWMTKKAGADDAAKMVLNLSHFFELALNHGNPVSTVKKELELARCYFDVQNVRFNHRFELIIEVPEELEAYTLLNILLQPLVENSIYHGLEMLEAGGVIRISASFSDEYLTLCVEDNGIGFPPDSDPVQSGGYALQNISDRLKLNYGQDSSLNICSVPDQGTRVTVRIYKPTPDFTLFR
ncbi:MAG: sensor histidine kinase [Lachnospiraceae bacterium]|nr:sensor histidine kinase [Lachnospiraceae bacterium]